MRSIIAIAGPTAVGKTAIGLSLAEERGAEIISADSRQIYSELTIGTAKPTEDDLRRVPHHFIGELSIETPYSAGEFQRDAARRIAEVHQRGRSALVVGGSTLYLHALKRGLANVPEIPPNVRLEISDRLEREGAERLFAELQSLDPALAARMDATKTQRLIRGLEVFYATGRPLSSYFRSQESPPFEVRMFVLNRERRQLYERINHRVDQMLKEGLIEEVEGIMARGYDPELNPLRTIGYQEPIAYIKGEIGYEEMVRLLKRNTRHYAKRQVTWFRRDDDNIWIDAAQPADAVQQEILAIYEATLTS